VSGRILVAGVGNLFRGDDGFGPEVARRLATRPLPPGVRVLDAGTRGHDLAYAILDGYDAVILVDAIRRGGPPGTLYAVEPAAADLAGPVGTHGVDLPAVFALVRAMGGTRPPIRLVGCEPAELGPDDEGAFGLSPAVAAVVGPAVRLVEDTVADLCRA
jgi:hydrogenase maturation protease